MRYLFEDYALDTDRRELRRGPDLIPLAPQAFDLLVFLIRNRDRVVSKDNLIAEIWNGRVLRLEPQLTVTALRGRLRHMDEKALDPFLEALRMAGLPE